MTALKALIKRDVRTGLCSPDIPTLTEMAESTDDALFQRIMYDPYHVIHHLLPARSELVYNIRQRHHDRQLAIVYGQLRNRNSMHRICSSRTVSDSIKLCYSMTFVGVSRLLSLLF